jgi:hypothetical protein
MNFDNEIFQIKNEIFRVFCKKMANWILPLIREVPSSWSGKTHPPDESGEWGMVIHSKRVAKLSIDLCREHSFSNFTRDAMIGAALFHDIGRVFDTKVKRGSGHGPLSTHIIKTSKTLYKFIQNRKHELDRVTFKMFFDSLQRMFEFINTHSTHWDQFSPQPNNLSEHIFATADYIASRKYLYIPIPIDDLYEKVKAALKPKD